jgi:CheY-like chemotaxis protein
VAAPAAASALAVTGYRLLEAADGAAALTLDRAERPALAVLDVYMPGPDGFRVCRAIKDDPALASTIVVLLTAQSGGAARELGRAAGADAYLTKPFSPHALLRLVAQRTGEQTDT